MRILESDNYDFGKFRLNKTDKVLRYEDEMVSLPLKSIELLCLLVGKKGEVVSKNEIFETVWQNTFVEESVLAQNIYTLRKAFEHFGEKDLIITVPRRGYLFKYDREIETSFKIEREIYEEIAIIEEEISEPQTALPPAKKNRTKYIYPVFAVIVLFAVTTLGYFFWSNDEEKKSLAEINSIAILPVKTLTESENEKILAHGIREKISASLGNLKGLKVLTAEIGEAEIDKLNGFDAVLLGTIQQSEDKVRVNLRLLHTKNSEQIWTGTFNELKTDIFQLQDKISDEIARWLSLNLSKQDREIIFKRETGNKEAYEQYLQGRYFFSQRGDNYSLSLEKAKTFFEKAVEIDPNFAEAYIGLANVINLQTDNENKFDSKYTDGYEKSKELISKGLAINPNLAEAYAAMGWIQYRYEWNFAEAEKSFSKALELNENLPNIYLWLSTIYSIKGNSEKSIGYAEKAVELEPTFSRALANLSTTYAYNGQCENAVELFPRVEQYISNQGSWLEQKGNVLTVCRRCEEAIPVLEEAKKLLPKGRVVAYNLGYCYAKTNQPEKAREELKILDLEPITGAGLFGKILVYDALGEREKALNIFSDFYRTKDARSLKILYDPRFEDFKNEPRFKEITQDLILNE